MFCCVCVCVYVKQQSKGVLCQVLALCNSQACSSSAVVVSNSDECAASVKLTTRLLFLQLQGIELPPVEGLVVHALGDDLMQADNWQRFRDFVSRVSAYVLCMFVCALVSICALDVSVGQACA